MKLLGLPNKSNFIKLGLIIHINAARIEVDHVSSFKSALLEFLIEYEIILEAKPRTHF